MIPAFAQLPIPVTLALFLAAAAGVWFAGGRLAIYADAIADRKRIGQAFMGLVFVAAATSLPEIVTTLFGAISGEPKLVLGNIFGVITTQTAILAFVDALFVTAALTSYPRKPTSALEAALLVVLLSLLLALCAVGEYALPFGPGLGTLGLALVYVAIVVTLRQYGEDEVWVPVEIPETTEPLVGDIVPRALDRLKLSALIWTFVLLSLVILVCGVVLTAAAAAIANQTGMSSSFIGIALLASVTCLPELSTTVAAVRIGAHTLAISNIFGSNLLMIALVLPADFAYGGAPILDSIDAATTFALISGIFVTAVYLAGLLIRSRKTLAGMGYDSAIVIFAFACNLLVVYRLSQ